MRARIPLWTLALGLAAQTAAAATIVELWEQVKAPAPPLLAPATVKAAETGYLLLDIEQANCNPERRPRCVATVPAMAAFLERARAARMPVFYSNVGSGSRQTILPAVAARDEDPIVKAGVNKFIGTQLDAHLKARNIKTVIVCGTAAFGAALHTATGAAQHGYNIVLPVDCVSGSSLYEEQAALWGLINGPGTSRVITATTLDAIRIE